MCWAGVEEYVFYIDSKTFVSVSGYGINKDKALERMNRLSKNFYFDTSKLQKVYNQGLKPSEENIEELKILIRPLCHMISLLQISIGNISQAESKNKTFDSILSFVQRNAMQEITLRNIADACACSESTVSHLFKEHTNQSVKQYINNLRIKQAEKFILSSDIPISNIALLCGFQNTNYFSTSFKKYFGVSPKEYRLKNNII
jgi:two-component system response regulator YesN